MKIRKIIVFCIITIGVLLALYSIHKSEIDYIDREIDSYYYSEQDVKNLEYLLKEYYSDPINDNKRKLIIYNLINNGRGINYQYTDDDIEKYVDELEKNYHDNVITDYHNMAISMLDSHNDELTDEYVSDEIISLQEQIDVVVIVVFAFLYVFFIFKFTFFNTFDKKTYIKNIIKYLVSLLITFALNIAVCYAVDKYVNYLGHYRGRGFYQFWNLPNILDYGILTILQVIIVFILSLIINGLLNMKDIKKCFTNKKKSRGIYEKNI